MKLITSSLRAGALSAAASPGHDVPNLNSYGLELCRRGASDQAHPEIHLLRAGARGGKSEPEMSAVRGQICGARAFAALCTYTCGAMPQRVSVPIIEMPYQV